jgi:hypothetical protein
MNKRRRRNKNKRSKAKVRVLLGKLSGKEQHTGILYNISKKLWI